MHTSDELPATGSTGPTPVFLDATGRRLKRARLVGGTVTAAVAAYVVLLLSAALGGPSIDAPFLPRPAAPTRGLAALPSATPVTGPQAGSSVAAAGRLTSPGQAAVWRGVARSTVAPVAATAPGSPAGPAGPTGPSATAPAGSPVPVATTGTPTPPATTPTTSPTATPTHTGRSASAPGHTARPTVSRTR